MNVAIIGTGLIGKKRAQSLPGHVNLKTVCDIDLVKGNEFAYLFNCIFEKSWQKVVKDKRIQAIFISVTNNNLSRIANSAISSGKHVLIEKPGGINIKQLRETYTIYKRNPIVVMYGYNHRYHPAIQKAKQLIDSQRFGNILFIRARYGHGGRLGYEKEWRFQKEVSGGGELIDQGCHLIDLVNFFCGEMDQATGFITNLFWKTKLEDAAFFQLRNKKNQVADLSVTCVEWKNIFSFEIMLQNAKIQIDGLGGSYGKEKLILYKMRPEMGPPDKEEFEFTDEDTSWKDENNLFFNKIKQKDYNNTSIKEAMYVLGIIEKLYQKNIV
ncbi:Gfo/Idh/MocA family oxidoreductase [Candidatus Daviesbacteria bacterium]|nr:Gfo/Idh/MocA family oxidoreductase [Candidatus Daviesbacteria bacterium]